LVNELDEETSEERKKLKDYERTSLNNSVQLFKKFLVRLESSWKNKRILASDAKMEF